MKTNNATKAAMKAYNCKDKSIAAKVGSENLKKPDIIQYFKDNAGIASSYMVSVIENPDDRTSDKITAAKDVLDRA
jgi:phage terminase small subunit